MCFWNFLYVANGYDRKRYKNESKRLFYEYYRKVIHLIKEVKILILIIMKPLKVKKKK